MKIYFAIGRTKYHLLRGSALVEVNNREGMEVEILVKETAINVIQRVYEFKSTKKAQHDVSITSCYHCQN